MKPQVTTLIALPVLVAAIGETRAQDAEAAATGEPRFSVRLGATRLSDGPTRRASGSGGFEAAVGLAIRQCGRAEVEYARTSGNNRVKTLGVNYTHVLPLNKQEFRTTGQGAYAGLGIGVYRVSADFGGGGSGIAAMSDSATRIGGKILVGYQFQNRYFVEAGFTKIGSVRGADPSRFGASLGIRF
jgi:hypothetical protein